MGGLPHSALAVVVATLLLACGSDSPDDPASDGEASELVFDLDGALDTRQTFFDAPFPSDLRLTADGTPNLDGFPNPRDTPILGDLIAAASQSRGINAMPVGYFRFSAPVASRVESDVIAPEADGPILLVDIDPDSPERGRLYPVVARTLFPDDSAGANLLAAAPAPGIVLTGGRTYAIAVLRSAGDALGEPLGVAGAMADLAADVEPAGARGAAALAAYTPLFETLDQLAVDRTEVAAATVFTVGDAVADLFELSERVRAAYDVSIVGIALDDVDGDHGRYCELVATVDMPQFQRGDPPFNDEGLFDIDSNGLPILQRTETAQVVFSIPKSEMPAAGYPLLIYFHGSGGVADRLVDAGPTLPGGDGPEPGLGPAHEIAPHGIAGVGAALPLSPDRLPRASSIEYLNFNNLAAFRDTFRQGVLESRLLIDAVFDLRIDPATLGDCAGPTLPAGEDRLFFDPGALVASGQSMGGMYTNLVGAVDPRIRAAVPTGAGGHWSSMILGTDLIDAGALIAVLLGTPFEELTFLHPGMYIMELAWEAAEPYVFMPRLAQRPLPGHPVRPVYQPVGLGDEYFDFDIFDGAALAYGNQQAGDDVWPTMQASLALRDLDGFAAYPVTDNRTSDDGTPYTGVVVQYESDGIRNSHYIYAQLDAVKHQYACFLATFLGTGSATVFAPSDNRGVCPGAPSGEF